MSDTQARLLWKCCGCGAPGRVRYCACATSIVYRAGGITAWKREPSFGVRLGRFLREVRDGFDGEAA